jgi:hypothetical protein
VALLTHGAYRAHDLFRPDLNEFDSLVCDESPEFVYRTPRLSVTARATASARASWDVEPLDGLLRLVDRALVVPSADTEVIIQKLQERRQRLVKQASKLRSEVTEGSRISFEYKVEELEPLLSLDEFAEFAALVRRAVHADVDPENTPDEVSGSVGILRDFCGDTSLHVLAQQEFQKDGAGCMNIVRPVNGFPDFMNGPAGRAGPLIVLDATAGLDPRYLLAGGFEEERLPAAEFPNTTVVLTSSETVTKTKAHRLAPEQVALDVADQLRRHGVGSDSRVLLVTDKSSEPGIRHAVAALQRDHPDALPAIVLVDHFGNLRGKNKYINCDVVYFTQVFRRPGEYYLGLQLLLAEFDGYPRQWASKNADPWNICHCAPEVLHASMVCDLYQDLMRIVIRHDPSATARVFLPTSDPRIVTRILRLMRGVSLVLPDGKRVSAPSDKGEVAVPDSRDEAPARRSAW